MAISAAGVWVIDAKAYGGSLEVCRAGGLFSPRVEHLWIGGRNKTALVEGVLVQAAAVRREFSAVVAGVGVHRVLAFVGTDLPWSGASSVNGVALASRRRLAKLVRQPGHLDEQERRDLAASWRCGSLPPD